MKPTDVRNPNYYHKVVDCQWACPAHTNVPEYIRLIAQGATRSLHAQPGVQRLPGHPRPHLRPPLRAGLPPRTRRRRSRSRSAASSASPPTCATTSPTYLPKAPADRRTASASRCIGAGPASLTVANDLLPLGYEVVIFEQLRARRRADAHQHPVVPPARAGARRGDRATSSTWASRSATTRRSRA